MADLNSYLSDVRVQTRAVFMAIYTHPFLLLKLDEPAVTPVAPADDEDWESHTRVSVGIGKTGSFAVLRHNAGLYRVFPLKPGSAASKLGAQQPAPPPPLPASVACAVPPAKEPIDPQKLPTLISIGRTTANDIVIADNAISKQHAIFSMAPSGDITLIDKASRNGTSVRGRRLVPETPVSVSFGDPILMGGLAIIIIGAGALWEIIHSQLTGSGSSSSS